MGWLAGGAHPRGAVTAMEAALACDGMEGAFEAITAQTREAVHAAGFSDVAIGLSGGLDSSVVAALAVEALGANRVHGVLMPGPFSSGHSVADAEDLAAALGIDRATVPITGAYEAFDQAFCEAGLGALEGLASQNTQARCRMVCLMALSNARRWLVLNTGNRSEAYMGYSTLYGDMAGAFAPLGGLYKTQVYELARWMNGRARAEGRPEPIPEHVLAKPPSAELAPGQSDEEALGLGYAELDALLAARFDEGRSLSELEAVFGAATVQRVLGTVERMAFKRALEPPCAQVQAV